MNHSQHPHRSQLFTLRVWWEELGESQAEWRGQIQHVASGETRYFRNWPAAIRFILATLPWLDDANRLDKPIE
jgi:hypothetical protein